LKNIRHKVLTAQVNSSGRQQQEQQKPCEDAATTAVMGSQLASEADVTVGREDRTWSFGAGEVFGAHRAHRHLQVKSAVTTFIVNASQLK
jgi:hypothetical protein